MRISTKCSIALHCLICIAVFDGRRMTSTGLAASTGSNPVVIRNLFGALQKAGILSVARGTGGAVLLRSPEEITVWDVYAALESDEKHELLGIHPNPSPQCPVGSRIRSCSRSPMMRPSLPCEKDAGDYPADLLDRWREQAGGSFPPAL